MPKLIPILSPLPGNLVFAFSYVDQPDGQRYYHVIYNEALDEHKKSYQLVGAMYKLMKDYPFLVEPMLLVAQQAAEELSEPFTEILKQK